MRKKREQALPRTVNCAICSTPFETRHSQGKYCSPEHQREGERASWRKYGEANREDRREYHRKHYLEVAGAVSARVAKYRQTEIGKAVLKKTDHSQKAKFPEKVAARQAVKIALKNGTLVRKPCEDCGEVDRVHGHHADYSKPLVVKWLCFLCHNAEHRRLRELERQNRKSA